MKTLVVLLAGLLVFGMAWQSRARAPSPLPADKLSALAAGNNRFAIDLYHHLAAKSHGDLFVSPESISLALAMTYAGARGETAEQMAKTLHFDLPPEKLNADFAAILHQWNAGGEKNVYRLSIANRLWAKQGYTFLKPFLAITRDDFGAELAQLDFVHQTEAARTTINAWVAKETHDKIKDLIGAGALNADTRLVLTNAIYFKGDWLTPFAKTSTANGPFHLTADKTGDVPMMHERASFLYSGSADLQVLEMPYKGNDLAMVVLLPTKIDGLAGLEKSLTADRLANWLGGLRRHEVQVSLPKFKLTHAIELSDVLSAMGMPLAFSANADFSGMNGKRDLSISAVIHKAYVAVDEKGTEAAAATAVVMRALAMRVPREIEHFNADHPFIFMIRDVHSGSILFLGRYTGPTAK